MTHLRKMMLEELVVITLQIPHVRTSAQSRILLCLIDFLRVDPAYNNGSDQFSRVSFTLCRNWCAMAPSTTRWS
jgi:hypothetical protein